MRNANRPWCAKARYPGLDPFLGGTVVMPADAASHEVETALIEHFRRFLPDGFEIIEPVCGALFFTEGEA
ncbi:hypothetical protein [Pontibaca methylaminivorans]|nr:hypothetical protein [Pontibaca methylaminivorans]